MPLSLPVILGTVREDNATQPVAEYALERLEARDDVTSTLIEPDEIGLGNLQKRLPNADILSNEEEFFLDILEDADGFVFATPEYNHGYPGTLKNVIDHTWAEWNRKAYGLVTTGGSKAGVRAEDQLRTVINGGLGGAVVPQGVNVPNVGEAFTDEGPADEETWQRRFDKLAARLVVYAEAMQTVRERLDD
jgi:NAD(P)H-dependent FMN reductase